MPPYMQDEDERTEGPLDSAEALLEEGRRYQREAGVAPFLGRRPSLWPWAVLAIMLMVISLGIEIFWPLPGRHGPLPACTGPISSETVSCQRVAPSSAHSH